MSQFKRNILNPVVILQFITRSRQDTPFVYAAATTPFSFHEAFSYPDWTVFGFDETLRKLNSIVVISLRPVKRVLRH